MKLIINEAIKEEMTQEILESWVERRPCLVEFGNLFHHDCLECRDILGRNRDRE